MTATLPAGAIGGQKIRARAALHLNNRTSAPISGAATVTLFLSADELLDDADVAIGKALTKRLKLPRHSSKDLPLKLSSLPDVPDGAYHLLARLERTGVGAEVVATPTAFAVKAAVAELQVSAAGEGAGDGPRYVVPVAIQNLGNMTARGPATLSLSFEPTAGGVGAPAVATAQVKLNIKPGATLVRKVIFQLPATLPPGSSTPALALNVDAIPHARLQSSDALILPASLN